MAFSKRRLRVNRERDDNDVSLNITPMMDIFTIILVFLLKAYSAQGQLVTPARGLLLPTSSVQKVATEALSVKVMSNQLLLEDKVVLDEDAFKEVFSDSSNDIIVPLYDLLVRHAEEAKKTAETFGGTFSGKVTIQGDLQLPFKFLTKVMNTCGQTGYSVMKLLVYRED
jgi:biopolymer transport protein ExbD